MGERRETLRMRMESPACIGSPQSQEREEAVIKNASVYHDMMTFTLKNETIDEHQGVIRFLTAEGVKPAAIHRHGGCDCAPWKCMVGPLFTRVTHVELVNLKQHQLDRPA
ncbi:hypothetical protein TNCV_287031 [Trichonephila clavipes]|nr:hypothetical protein TNCV_287031 [Trichonephila clavipes]